MGLTGLGQSAWRPFRVKEEAKEKGGMLSVCKKEEERQSGNGKEGEAKESEKGKEKEGEANAASSVCPGTPWSDSFRARENG